MVYAKYVIANSDVIIISRHNLHTNSDDIKEFSNRKYNILLKKYTIEYFKNKYGFDISSLQYGGVFLIIQINAIFHEDNLTINYGEYECVGFCHSFFQKEECFIHHLIHNSPEFAASVCWDVYVEHDVKRVKKLISGIIHMNPNSEYAECHGKYYANVQLVIDDIINLSEIFITNDIIKTFMLQKFENRRHSEGILNCIRRGEVPSIT